MLKKDRRVKRVAFKALDRAYKTVMGDYFLLRIFKIPAGVSKFAVSISKKIEKKAVLRNKIRRLSYKAIESKLKDVPDGFIFHLILNQKLKDFKNDITKDINILIK